MNPLLTTLGGRLAERWLNQLLLPGALFLGACAVGGTLGHAHWHDVDRLADSLDALARRPAADRPGTAAVLAAAGLLLASAATLAAQFLGAALERLWLRDAADPLSRALVRRRGERWRRADAARIAAIRDARTPPEEIERRYRARDRIAPAEPSRPTWCGDRMQAAAQRVAEVYGIDLVALWPRLWLVLAEPAQRQIGVARDSFAAACRLAAWAAGYAVLAAWWWPAAAIALTAAAVARARAREAVDALAVLAEAAVDVHGRELAALTGLIDTTGAGGAAGAEPAGPLPHQTGERLSELFRKGD
ncbi:hypothetical protein [Streptomyces sp. PR69]|uniref:hypothetical protein n=1 Tax=Streptomyces sp. PR69 TaxID=2984950 RepID=UPI0022656263|nr:hypothetical protein [Streptomyces sp. PR69]